jgi:NAD(P)-dependent dehydrogenase (short-subunit alcohol dehydrogenase family)
MNGPFDRKVALATRASSGIALATVKAFAAAGAAVLLAHIDAVAARSPRWQSTAGKEPHSSQRALDARSTADHLDSGFW